jgi:hypothetical protein
MGAGWSFNYESQLTPTSCGLWVVQTADGSSQSFRTTDEGQTFSPQKGYHTKLLRSGDGWDFIDKSGTKHRFREPASSLDPGGSKRLEYIEEPHGDRIVPRYDITGRVIAVSEVQAPNATPVRTVAFTYVSAGGRDRVATASLAALGLRVEYRYDVQGNLLEAKRLGTNLSGQPRAEDRVETYEYSTADVRDRLVHAAFDVGREGCVRPIQHGLIVDQNASEAADGGHVRDRTGVIDMMPVGRGQGPANDLMNPRQQFGRIGRAQHFLDEPIDPSVAESIDVLKPHLLFGQAFPQQAGGVGVIKDMATELELHLELRDRERPGADQALPASGETSTRASGRQYARPESNTTAASRAPGRRPTADSKTRAAR